MSAEEQERACPDGGKCWHGCGGSACWRVGNAEPLSGVYEGDAWPLEVMIDHGAPIRRAYLRNPTVADVMRVVADELACVVERGWKVEVRASATDGALVVTATLPATPRSLDWTMVARGRRSTPIPQVREGLATFARQVLAYVPEPR